MSNEPRARAHLYSQIDVSNAPYTPPVAVNPVSNTEVTALLRELLAAQDRQNELMEELVGQMSAVQRQRAAELGQWKQANPRLAKSCRAAAEALSKVQSEYLTCLTEEITENFETLRDGEFMLNEFVDRFGPRMAHLNGLLQVLCQLGANPEASNTSHAP